MSYEPQPTYILSADLGQASDYTALCVDELQSGGKAERVHHIRHLDRFPLGTPYPKQVDGILKTYKALPNCRLVVDMTPLCQNVGCRFLPFVS